MVMPRPEDKTAKLVKKVLKNVGLEFQSHDVLGGTDSSIKTDLRKESYAKKKGLSQYPEFTGVMYY